MPRWFALPFLSPLLAISLVAFPARATDPAAEALFKDGRALLDDGQIDAACDKLAASQALEARSGTLISLAYCHEQQGKTATAWGEYQAAIALANEEGRPDFATNATQFAQAIEPKLSHLTIVLEGEPQNVFVTLDGKAVERGMFGTAIPIDPGEHALEANALGFVPWRHTVTIGATADRQRVTVPALQPEAPGLAPMQEAPFETTPAPTPAPTPESPAVEEGGVPVWAWVVGGIGLASLLVSGAFLGDQLAAAGAIEDACGPERNLCPRSYDFSDDFSREKRDNALFIGFGIGGAVAITAAVIGIVTAPSEGEPISTGFGVHPVIGPEGAAVVVDAAF